MQYLYLEAYVISMIHIIMVNVIYIYINFTYGNNDLYYENRGHYGLKNRQNISRAHYVQIPKTNLGIDEYMKYMFIL